MGPAQSSRDGEHPSDGWAEAGAKHVGLGQVSMGWGPLRSAGGRHVGTCPVVRCWL